MPLPDWFHEAAARVNNWGRWGDDDELGTLNLITPEVVKRAAGCVRTGRSFSLAWPLSFHENLQKGNLPGRSVLRTMTAINDPMLGDPALFTSSDDVVVMGLQVATHWDGLAHVSYDGRMYNGVPTDSVTAAGASRLGIHKVRSVVSRGVLLDVARTHGVDRLEGGYGVTPEDLSAAQEAAGVDVGPGDVVLVRTGQMQVLLGRRPDRNGYAMSSPGLDWRCAEWFHQRDVAAVAVDNLTFDPYPVQDPAAFFPIHLLHLVEMGMLQGQNWVLEELAADCAADGVHDFLLEASPQPFTNAVGSPVNPVATK
jgi:kynurenine formamidase